MEVQLPFTLSHYLGTLAGGLVVSLLTIDVSTYCLSAVIVLFGIRSLVGFGESG